MTVITWKNYDEFRPHGTLAGHIWNPDNITTREVKERLSEVRGHLVWMPMKFLEGEVLVNETDLSVNYMTMNIYT